MLVSDTTPVSETFLFFQIRGWSKGCHFLHLLREVQTRCFISWQLYLLTQFSQYCTLKTAYDSKTSPCPSHYEQVKEAWSSLVATTARENNGTLVRLKPSMSQTVKRLSMSSAISARVLLDVPRHSKQSMIRSRRRLCLCCETTL